MMPRIHGYTTLMSPVTMRLPFLETLVSWSAVCEQIHVCYSRFPKLNLEVPDGAVAPWEDDGSLELLKQFNKEVLDNKLNIIEHTWDYNNPLEDGVTKQIARSAALQALEGDEQAWLAQFDADEILREQDVPKIIDAINEDNEVKEMAHRHPFIITGILELFGSEEKVRFGFGNWLKIRLTRNIPDLAHGLPIRIGNMAVRGRNPRTGKIISLENRDDGAGFIFSRSLARPNYDMGIWLTNKELLVKIIQSGRHPENSAIWTELPYDLAGSLDSDMWIYHTSWVDIKRKWSMGWFFDNFWSVLSGKQDTFTEKADKSGAFTRTHSANSDEDLQKELSRYTIKDIPGLDKPELPFMAVSQWRSNNKIQVEP